MKNENSIKIIRGLVGQRCERSLVANSLKFRFGTETDPRGTSYIWIDPPWYLIRADEVVTTAWDVPDPDDANYETQFENWSKLFDPLNDTILEDASLESDGKLILKFSSGLSLEVPHDPKDDDHWYAVDNAT